VELGAWLDALYVHKQHFPNHIIIYYVMLKVYAKIVINNNKMHTV